MPFEVKIFANNGWKLRFFESLSWLWETRLSLLCLASLLRFVMSFMIWWALDNPVSMRPFKCFTGKHYYITRWKISRAIWSAKVRQWLYFSEPIRLSKCLGFREFLVHFLTSRGCMQTFFYASYDHDITKRRSDDKPQKTHIRKNIAFQSELRPLKFLSVRQFLKHFWLQK